MLRYLDRLFGRLFGLLEDVLELRERYSPGQLPRLWFVTAIVGLMVGACFATHQAVQLISIAAAILGVPLTLLSGGTAIATLHEYREYGNVRPQENSVVLWQASTCLATTYCGYITGYGVAVIWL